MDSRIIKQDKMNQIITSWVSSYINNGYWFNTYSMKGMQSGSIFSVDLTNGKDIVRIYTHDEDFARESRYIDGQRFIISICKCDYQSNYHKDILWSQDFTNVKDISYIVIRNRFDIDGVVYILENENNKQFIEDIWNKQEQRFINKHSNFYNKTWTDNKTKKIVLPFIKRQSKHKSTTISGINKIEKCINYDEHGCYKIYLNKHYTPFVLK